MFSFYNIIRAIKSRQITWAGHVARTGDRIGREIWWENLKKRDNLEEQGEDGRIVLKWVVKKCDRGTRTGFIWLSTRTGGGLL